MPRWLLAASVVFAAPAVAADPWLSLPGGDGPGKGKSVVLLGGDEEYRSEEALPQLAKILSARHGFDCAVLFAVDPADGAVNPNYRRNVPGLDKLAAADLLVVAARFRDLPDDQMKHVVDYLLAGKPVVGLRTATHAFNLSRGSYRRFSFDAKEPGFEGGFGRVVLGETWVAHHGRHGHQGTRGVVAPGQEGHPVVRGLAAGSVFGPTDVYTARPPADATVLVLGQVTETLDPKSDPVAGPKNDPMMPVAWARTYRLPDGKPGRAFTTTMGASQDLAHEGTRRLVVNGCYWAVGLDDRIPPAADVGPVGDYNPTPFGFKKDAEWKPGKPPAAYGE